MQGYNKQTHLKWSDILWRKAEIAVYSLNKTSQGFQVTQATSSENKLPVLCRTTPLVWMPRGALLISYTENEWFHMLMPSLHQCPTNGVAMAFCSLAGMLALFKNQQKSAQILTLATWGGWFFLKKTQTNLTSSPGSCSVLLLNAIISRWVYSNLNEYFKKTGTAPQ